MVSLFNISFSTYFAQSLCLFSLKSLRSFYEAVTRFTFVIILIIDKSENTPAENFLLSILGKLK